MAHARHAVRQGRKAVRPDVFQYHEYRSFLSEWLLYRKAIELGFSRQSFSRSTGIAPGLLSMILSGKRPLTQRTLTLMIPELDLSQSEQRYFEALVALGNAESQEERHLAIERMRKYRSYRTANPREAEVHRYMSRWYHVAIREMSDMPGFRLDAEWIQARLKYAVDLEDIREAIRFLTENQFIEKMENGAVAPPSKTIECVDEIYKIALTEYHRQMLALAAKSLETVPSGQRNVMAHTVALDKNGFLKASKVIEETLEKLKRIASETERTDSVYHLEIALFPLAGEFT